MSAPPLDTVPPRMLVNGQAGMQIPVLDRGLQYGDGLFETLRWAGGRLCWFERHMARLMRGCERLGIALPDATQLRAEATSLARHLPRALVKIIVTRGTATVRGYRPAGNEVPTRIVSVHEWPVGQQAEFRVGLSPVRINGNPLLAGIKHLNRLEQVLAQRAAGAAGLHEVLMCSERGTIACGSMSNLFVWQRDELLTPPAIECAVAGVMRALVLEAAARLGLRVREQSLSAHEVDAAPAMLLTNVRLGLQPVHWYEGRALAVDERGARLMEWINGAVE
jgi:4-amino-4-deoxychorismate lyase